MIATGLEGALSSQIASYPDGASMKDLDSVERTM